MAPGGTTIQPDSQSPDRTRRPASRMMTRTSFQRHRVDKASRNSGTGITDYDLFNYATRFTTTGRAALCTRSDPYAIPR